MFRDVYVFVLNYLSSDVLLDILNFYFFFRGIGDIIFIIIWIGYGIMKNKKEIIHVLSSIDATRLKMPKYYPACRCGKHRSKKDYNRKDKSWQKEEW